MIHCSEKREECWPAISWRYNLGPSAYHWRRSLWETFYPGVKNRSSVCPSSCFPPWSCSPSMPLPMLSTLIEMDAVESQATNVPTPWFKLELCCMFCLVQRCLGWCVFRLQKLSISPCSFLADFLHRSCTQVAKRSALLYIMISCTAKCFNKGALCRESRNRNETTIPNYKLI